MKSKTARLTAAAVIVIVTAVAIKQVVLQKLQAQSTKRITQYSKNETVKDSKTPKIGESVEKSSADADTQAKKVKRVRHGRALSVISRDRQAPPDKAKIEAEAKQIQEMAATGDINGLIKMLSIGEFPSKVASAEHLGEIGDERALPELKRLNKENGGWWIEGGYVSTAHDSSGAFAVAICKILTRGLPLKERIERLFDLLEGRGPAAPEGIKERTAKYNFDVGKRVAAELDKIDDPSIVGRLRESENKGAAIGAVWMEVCEMNIESAIKRCMEIARDEGGAQRYGAIHCLGKFNEDAIDRLDELAKEGHGEAVTVLGYYKEDPKVFKLLCGHLTNNKNSWVRHRAADPVAFVESQSHRLKSLKTLVKALYDSSKYIRRSAAFNLRTRAYRQNKSYFDQIEDSLLVAALKHPDADVRNELMKAVNQLNYEWLDEQVGEVPPIRTDLEEQSMPPLTAEQRLKAKTEPMEKEATKALKNGPAKEAVKLYEQLLELRPDYEPYEQALDKAKAYVKAAEDASENWYPDAPYIGLKGRYSYYLASKPEDTSTLKEKFDLASFLQTRGFKGWPNTFGKDPKAKDQFLKALKLYEHIVEYYPENEYLVICSNAAIGGLNLYLYKDTESYVLAYIDVFATPVEDVVDSTDNRRNKPLEEAGGKTQAQLDFERFYKDSSRDWFIERCTRAPEPKLQMLFNEIIEKCAQTDPKIVEMAKIARRNLHQNNTQKMD